MYRFGSILAVSATLVLPFPAQLHGQGGPGPQCLHFDTPAGAWGGEVPGSAEGANVLADCSAFPSIGNAFDFGWDSSADWWGRAPEEVHFNSVQHDFAVWTAASRAVSFRFFLAGVLQYDSDWLHPGNDPIWWRHDVRYDAIEIRGALPVIFYRMEDTMEPEWADGLAGEQWIESSVAASTVPEPATITLIGTGLMGLAAARRRSRLVD